MNQIFPVPEAYLIHFTPRATGRGGRWRSRLFWAMCEFHVHKMALGLNDFDRDKFITRALKWVALKNRDFFGLKWNSLRSFPFQPPKSPDFRGSPLPIALVMDLPASNHYVSRHIKWRYINSKSFFYFCGLFLPSWIWIRGPHWIRIQSVFATLLNLHSKWGRDEKGCGVSDPPCKKHNNNKINESWSWKPKNLRTVPTDPEHCWKPNWPNIQI